MFPSEPVLRFMYEDLIARLATHFTDLRTGTRDAGIGTALEFVREQFGAGASTIYLCNGAGGFLRNPNWRAQGPRTVRADPSREEFDCATDRLAEFEIVRVRHGSQDAARPPGSVVFVPLVARSALLGVLILDWRGVDCEPNAEEVFKSLRVVGDIMTGAIEQLRAEESLRRSEERLRDTQRLEALGRLSGGVAHDFNNFLTAIIGNCELLSDDLSDVAVCSDEVDEIRRAAQRASTLVDRILAFGRRGQSKTRVVDVRWIVADMEKLIRRVVGDTIDVVVDLGEDCEVVKADPGQIEQVLLNLVVNARDAMPDGGTLSIRVASRQIGSAVARRALAPGRYVELAVSDDGCGMTEETRSRLFEPFYTTRGCGKGTGLGLATVATIASELDGEVGVESQTGRGTTFAVLIPRVEESVAVLDETTERPTVIPCVETILVVEGEQVVRDLMRRILEHDGYKVLEACDETAALEISRSYPGAIDGIVVDLALPHLQGRALVAELVAGRPQLAAVYTSCYAEADLRDEGVLEESVVCVEKPFGPHSLVLGVRRALDARPLATSEGVISSRARAPRRPYAPYVTPIRPARLTRPTRSTTSVPGAIAADSETLDA